MSFGSSPCRIEAVTSEFRCEKNWPKSSPSFQ